MIVAGSTAATVAIKQATADVPIVGPTLSDPIDLGLVRSYARPGANVTGILTTVEELAGKQLSLGIELVGGKPKVGVVAIRRGSAAMQLRGAQAAAAALAAELSLAEVDGPGQIDAAFGTLSRAGVKVVSVIGDAAFMNERAQIAASALATGLPTVYNAREHVEAGGLIELRRQPGGKLPAQRGFRRQNPEGRKPGGVAGRAADEVRAGDQPQDAQTCSASPFHPRSSPAPTR